jgi:hypothetical protein
MLTIQASDMTAIPEDQAEIDDGSSHTVVAPSVAPPRRYARSPSLDPTWMNQTQRSSKADAISDGTESIRSDAPRDSSSIASTSPDQRFHLRLLTTGEQEVPTLSYSPEPCIPNFQMAGNQNSSTTTFPVFRSSVFSLLGKFRSW